MRQSGFECFPEGRPVFFGALTRPDDVSLQNFLCLPVSAGLAGNLQCMSELVDSGFADAEFSVSLLTIVFRRASNDFGADFFIVQHIWLGIGLFRLFISMLLHVGP